MFADYTKLILRDYEHKKAENQLPLNLSNPTPARLRDECLIACKERFYRKDEKTLRDFFGQTGDHAAYLRIINNCDINRFKPLINFLKKPTIRTDEKNIELLAWLIDFKPRPYEMGTVNIPDETGNEVGGDSERPNDVGSEGVQNGAPEIYGAPPVPPSSKTSLLPSKRKFYFKTEVFYIGIVILGLIGVFIYRSNRDDKTALIMGHTMPTSGYCMYWAGDHYEPSPCTPKRGDTLLVDLDSAKLFRFKKITRPETITKDDIGRVAYIKLDGRIEYYTDTGFHPVYTHKRLKPLTRYIYEKYILPLKQ